MGKNMPLIVENMRKHQALASRAATIIHDFMLGFDITKNCRQLRRFVLNLNRPFLISDAIAQTDTLVNPDAIRRVRRRNCFDSLSRQLPDDIFPIFKINPKISGSRMI